MGQAKSRDLMQFKSFIVPILVHEASVTSEIVVVHDSQIGEFLIVHITLKEATLLFLRIQEDGNVAFLATWHLSAHVVDNPDIISWSRLAHGSWTDFHAIKSGSHQGCFSLAIALFDPEASLFIPEPEMELSLADAYGMVA